MSPYIWYTTQTIALNCSIRAVKRVKLTMDWLCFVQAKEIHWLNQVSIWLECRARVAFAANCIEWIVQKRWRPICKRPHSNAIWIDEMEWFLRLDFLSTAILWNCSKFAMTVRWRQHCTHIIKSMDEQSNVSAHKHTSAKVWVKLARKYSNAKIVFSWIAQSVARLSMEQATLVEST